MNPTSVYTNLKTKLASYLANYSHPSGSSPAIYLGSRPSDFRLDGSGLEVIVDPNPVRVNNPLLGNGTRVDKLITVYLVDRLNSDSATYIADLSNVQDALDVVTSQYPDCSVTKLNGDAARGVSSQHAIQIPVSVGV